MEPASALFELPSLKNLRRGQSEVVELFQNGQLNVTAKLPTGYGKTLTAATSYATLRAMGVVDKLLFVVPRTSQAQQAGEDVPDALNALGIKTKSCVVGDSPYYAVRLYKEGGVEVFIATIQSLGVGVTQTVVADMMRYGRWMIVVDEYHHYGQDSRWTEWLNTLPHQARLAMSATPDMRGEASPFGKPDVNVTYKDAVTEGAVKPLHLDAYNYRVEATNEDDKLLSFTLQELFDQAGSDDPDKIDKWQAARQMKWSLKYISPLIQRPVDRIVALRAGPRIRSQMLVQAMSCSHAEAVCKQLKTLLPEGMGVDWVGTGEFGRSDDENTRVLKEFCPPKQHGRRNWTLDVLVNVGMAGEGLDTVDVSEVVFLTSPSINASVLQQAGRASRVMQDRRQLVATLNVDANSKLGKFRERSVMDVFDDPDAAPPEEPKGEDVDPSGVGTGPDLIPLGPLVLLKDVTFLDVLKDPYYRNMADGLAKGFSQLPEIKSEMAVLSAFADNYVADYAKKTDPRYNENATREAARVDLNSRAHVVAFNLWKRMKSKYPDRVIPDRGKMCRIVNAEKSRLFGKVETANAQELEQHNKWVFDLQGQLERGEMPPWAVRLLMV